jgi:NDP-sugar pyrophosphorylase family protein
MKAILLAGGLGTRMREETEFRPKPMVEVGGRPVLWHIMKNLSHFGIHDFIVAAGYKSDVIKDYFLNYEARNNDFTVRLGHRNALEFHGDHGESDWSVTIADTGEATMAVACSAQRATSTTSRSSSPTAMGWPMSTSMRCAPGMPSTRGSSPSRPSSR